MTYRSLREACCEANRQLPRLGIVDLTFGNVSVADRAAGVFAIKPSGVAYEELRPEHMVILALETGPQRIVEGELRPSSDTPTHRCLYLNFPAAGAVVHTHSRNATAFAQAGEPIHCFGTTHADYFHGPVPVTREMTSAEVGGDYEWATGEVIVERFRDLDPAAISAVLVRSHAPFVWGPNAVKAVETAFALEVIAEMALKTLSLHAHCAAIPEHLHDKHYLRKHGSSAYYGQRG